MSSLGFIPPRPSGVLNKSATGVADANGNVSITLPQVDANEVWTGAIAITGSDAFTFWMIAVSNFLWDQGDGPGPYGPIQGQPADTVTVVGSSAVPGQSYTAQWVGRIEAPGHAEPLFPARGSGSAGLLAGTTTGFVIGATPSGQQALQVHLPLTPGKFIVGIFGTAVYAPANTDANAVLVIFFVTGDQSLRTEDVFSVTLSGTPGQVAPPVPFAFSPSAPLSVTNMLARAGVGTDSTYSVGVTTVKPDDSASQPLTGSVHLGGGLVLLG